MKFAPEIHSKLGFLLGTKHRKKVARGGRNGGKSYSFADAALARMISAPIIVTVCRELKTTIRDSVHQLLKERIEYHKLDHLFTITDHEIKCNQTDSILRYKHLHNNVAEVKGLQGTDVCWIFEAEALSESSWMVLNPTIRKDNAEIWIEFNPKYEDDFVWSRFVIDPDEDTIEAEINYLENPHCPQAMLKEALECQRRRPEEYAHVWMGKPQGIGSRIYPMFDKAIHVRDFDMNEIIERGAEFFMGQDPHTVYYPFAVWGARIPKGEDEFDYWIFNEFPDLSHFGGKFYYEKRNVVGCALTLKERANIFRVLDITVGDRQYPVKYEHRGLDTRFAKASGAASETLNTRGIIMEMADPINGGMVFETPMEGTIDSQRDRLKELLNYFPESGISSVNCPHFFVAPWCKNTIASFCHHRDDLAKNREDEKYKDPVDAVKIMFAVMAGYPHKQLQPVGAGSYQPSSGGSTGWMR